MERMKSVSCPRVISMSGATCEHEWLVWGVTVGAEAGDDVGYHHLFVLRLEEELPELVVAVLVQPAADVHREELVLRVPELRVTGHDPGALEAQPLVRPDAL